VYVTSTNSGMPIPAWPTRNWLLTLASARPMLGQSD
jgi:hypothetical protein